MNFVLALAGGATLSFGVLCFVRVALDKNEGVVKAQLSRQWFFPPLLRQRGEGRRSETLTVNQLAAARLLQVVPPIDTAKTTTMILYPNPPIPLRGTRAPN